MGVFVLSIIAFGIHPVLNGIQLVIQDQKKRDSCYAVGVANLPSSEDQTMLQGSQTYQECIHSH